MARTSPPPRPPALRGARRPPRCVAGGRCAAWPSASAPMCWAWPRGGAGGSATAGGCCTPRPAPPGCCRMCRAAGQRRPRQPAGRLARAARRAALPGEGAALRLQDLELDGTPLRPPGGSLWLQVEFDELRAARVDLALSDDASSDTEPPRTCSCRWASGGTLRVDELHVEGLDTPLRRSARAWTWVPTAAPRTGCKPAAEWDQACLDGRPRWPPAPGWRWTPPSTCARSRRPWPMERRAASGRPAGPPPAAGHAACAGRGGAAGADAGRQRHAAALCGLAAGRPAGQRTCPRPFGAAHRRTTYGARRGRSARTQGLDEPAALQLSLNNRDAGRWNEGRLPLRAWGCSSPRGPTTRGNSRSRPSKPNWAAPGRRRGASAAAGSGIRPAGASTRVGRRFDPRCWMRARRTCGWTAGCSSMAVASAAAHRTARWSRCVPPWTATCSGVALRSRCRCAWMHGSARCVSSCASCWRKAARRGPASTPA